MRVVTIKEPRSLDGVYPCLTKDDKVFFGSSYLYIYDGEPSVTLVRLYDSRVPYTCLLVVSDDFSSRKTTKGDVVEWFSR